MQKKFNKHALIESAIRLESLFLKYAGESEQAATAYQQCKQLIDRVKNGEISQSTFERCSSGYFTTEFDLFNYRDLFKAVADFNMYLQGWESEEAFNEYMEKILEK